MHEWRNYNKKLVNRARVDIYFSEEILSEWYSQDTSVPHRPAKYSNVAVKTCILVRTLFGLPYRQTEGMVKSLLYMLKAGDIEVPSYSQINRRQERCEIDEKIRKAKEDPRKMIIAIDSTGLSLYTPGQWHMRKHGQKKSRWLKLHAAVDADSGEVVDYQVTDSNYSDGKAAKDMLSSELNSCQIEEFLGDGAYDERELYRMLYGRGVKPNIRIRTNATTSENSAPELAWRDKQILQTYLDKWNYPELTYEELCRRKRLENGYGRRSISENLFSRFKALFGDKLSCRKIKNIKKEIEAKMELLNSFSTC